MNEGSLLRELGAILRDYQDRIDRIGAETFRLRGESFADWERKRKRIRLVLEVVQWAAEADEKGRLDALLREVAKAPERYVPAELLRPPGPDDAA